MCRKPLVATLAVLLAGPLMLLVGCDAASPETADGPGALAAQKSDVCHYDADADAYHLINVADAALPAHLAHGDASPGEAVPTMPGYAFGAACQPVLLPVLQQLALIVATYDTQALVGSGSGDVTGAVTPVDINLAGNRFNTSGCEEADFAGFPAGNIALIQRGGCNFDVKALKAEAAGASAVVIFNQGDTPERMELFSGTLGGAVVSIPVVAARFYDGAALAQPGSTARVMVPPLTP